MKSPLDDVEGQIDSQTTGSKTTKFLTVIGSLAAVGFVAITTYQNASPTGITATKTTLDSQDTMFTGAYAGGRTLKTDNEVLFDNFHFHSLVE